MPHLGQVIVLAIVEVMIVIGVRTTRSRAGNGRRVATVGVGADAHIVREIDPYEPANMLSLLAFEWTQAAPQRFCLNDAASKNM